MERAEVYKIYGSACLMTVVLLFLFITLNTQLDGTIWQTMQQSKSALNVEYCELDNTTHLFRQNMNTYSNLFYFFLGSIVILTAVHDRKNKKDISKNHVQLFPALSAFFGFCLMYLCLGSAFFHASLTWIGQRIDMNATYSICITLLGISSYRLFLDRKTTKTVKFFFIIILLFLTLVFVEIHLVISSSILLPLLIIIISTLTTLNYIRNKSEFTLQFALLSFILMILALILRTLDVKKIGCNPVSVYQGHAIWHVLTGMSAFCLYWFYRNEKLQTEKQKTNK